MKELKAYKVFDPDWSCRDYDYRKGGKSAIGTRHKINEKPILCVSGFHACTQLVDCFSYKKFDPDNKVAEVIMRGKITEEEDDCSKRSCNDIEIVKELTWEEVLKLVNIGKGNSGHRNSGDRNSGDWNSGDSNSGDRNSGDWNSGDWNSGHRNSGDRNSGHRNSGHRNSGDSNSGDRNSGDWNSGDWNSGDSNSGDWNSGVFCLDENPRIMFFDNVSDMTIKEWENHPARAVMKDFLDPNILISEYSMSDEEKEGHPDYKTTGGYLRSISLKEAWSNMWHNLDDDKKRLFTSLPNFDWEKFTEITGIEKENI